jgi:hypothetical protein
VAISGRSIGIRRPGGQQARCSGRAPAKATTCATWKGAGSDRASGQDKRIQHSVALLDKALSVIDCVRTSEAEI